MPDQKRPNILFIMTDEQRFDAIGYANPGVQTPHIDALARQGIAFTRAYTSNPSCVPARAAIFTGRYPSQCGAPTYITHLPADEVTFQAILRDAGYHTAVIGKQHFGRTDIDRGYDYEDIVDSHGPKGTIAERSTCADSYERFLHDAGFRSPNELSESDGPFARRWKSEPRFHVDAYVGDRAVEWVDDRRPDDKPWYLCVSFPGPHQPFDGIGLPHADLYDEASIDLPQTEPSDLDDKPPHFMDLANKINGKGGRPLTDDEVRHLRKSYYATVSLIDEKVGALVEALETSGDLDNTLVIFTSDHGDYLGDFGMVYKGQYLSEALMRVPFIVKPPSTATRVGREDDALVSTVDIPATCLRAAGVDIPDNMSSRDLSHFWGEAQSWDDDVYMEAQGLRGIRRDRWKLVHYEDRDYGELYDLEADPDERHNLWGDPAHSAVRAELRARVLNHIIKLSPRAEMKWNVRAPEI